MLAHSKRGLNTPRSIGSERTVAEAADQLIVAYGDKALDTASVYASRETGGLLYSAQPDYWNRVRRELESRFNRQRDAQAAPNLERQVATTGQDLDSLGQDRSKLAA